MLKLGVELVIKMYVRESRKKIVDILTRRI